MNSERIRFGLLGNISKENIIDPVIEVIRFLRAKNIGFVIEKELANFLKQQGKGDITIDNIVRKEKIALDSDIIVTFGGDGTMLAAARVTLNEDKPILGVNLGKLGFLAEVTAEDVIESLEMILDGNYSVEQRLTLVGRSSSSPDLLTALNDIVISKSGPARVIQLSTYVDDEFLASFHADGIIVSTPTGSTAYSLATGGPIVTPPSEVIIISPISAHTLTARPVIVPNTAKIEIEASIEEGEILVMADGLMQITSEHKLHVTITRSEHSVKLIKRTGSSYFETLRNKLMWGKDTRVPVNAPMNMKEVQ